MVKTDPAKKMEIEPVDAHGAIGTFVKNREVAERMLAGAKRHLNALPHDVGALRANGIKLSENELRGAIRRAKKLQRRKAFKGSEGFEATARLTRGSGPQGKALQRAEARKRAAEFNEKYGVMPDGDQDAKALRAEGQVS